MTHDDTNSPDRSVSTGPRGGTTTVSTSLRAHDVEVHLLVDHLLRLIDDPAPAAVGEWCADLCDILDRSAPAPQQRTDVSGDPPADTSTADGLRRLGDRLRRLHLDLGDTVVALDQLEHRATGAGDFDPHHLGRILLLSLLELIERQTLTTEQVVAAARTVVVERVPGQLDSTELDHTLTHLGDRQNLGTILRRIDQELLRSLAIRKLIEWERPAIERLAEHLDSGGETRGR